MQCYENKRKKIRKKRKKKRKKRNNKRNLIKKYKKKKAIFYKDIKVSLLVHYWVYLQIKMTTIQNNSSMNKS